MTHEGDDEFDEGFSDELRDTVKTDRPMGIEEDHSPKATLDIAALTVPLSVDDDVSEELSDTLEMVQPISLSPTNIVFDDALLDHDDEHTKEERKTFDATVAGLRASIVFRDDELAFVELEWSPESGHAFPASDEIVAAVYDRAARMGYPISLLLRRVKASVDEGRFIERHIVVFKPEPVEGDGRGVSIELQLGLDLDDEDYGRPAQAELLRDRWVERVTELVKQAYPKAQLSTMIFDLDADEVRVRTPLGIDDTDFEWRIDDLIESATEEIIEGRS